MLVCGVSGVVMQSRRCEGSSLDLADPISTFLNLPSAGPPPPPQMQVSLTTAAASSVAGVCSSDLLHHHHRDPFSASPGSGKPPCVAGRVCDGEGQELHLTTTDLSRIEPQETLSIHLQHFAYMYFVFRQS